MLSALFTIDTNSLISFHQQSSVLLHRCTTWKELLAVLSCVNTNDNALHRHADIPRGDIPPTPQINLKSTQPYYTNTILPIDGCRHPDIPRADIPHPHTNWTPSPQNTTTPNQYNLLRNEDIPSTNGPPVVTSGGADQYD